MTEYKLRYFNIRGRAEPIRWIFHFTGMEFEDERIDTADWPDIKPTVTYGQLPVLEFDGKSIFGSQPICRFLARLFGLCGQDDIEAAKCDELVDAMSDFVADGVKFFTEGDEDKRVELKDELMLSKVPKHLNILNDTIKERGGGLYLVEDGVTWADIYVSAWLETFSSQLDDQLLEPYEHVKTLLESVKALPGIREWIQARPVTTL